MRSKNKKFYGIKTKYKFGTWVYKVYCFKDKESAEKWVEAEKYFYRDPEEFDILERDLITKTNAIKLVGRKAVENAIEL